MRSTALPQPPQKLKNPPTRVEVGWQNLAKKKPERQVQVKAGESSPSKLAQFKNDPLCMAYSMV